MADATAIEWCDSTFNPWVGCTKIAPACDHCYAEGWAKRSGMVEWGNHPRRRTSPALWVKPHKWQAEAAAFRARHGRRRRVFCASLADVFDNQVPAEWRADLWLLIAATPDLDWLLLTKRPQNIAGMLPAFWSAVKGRIWLGTTVEDQAHAERNIPHLLQHDSAARFISVEPMLGPIDLVGIHAIAQADLPMLVPGTPLCSDPYCFRSGPHYSREFGCRWGKEPRGLPGIDWVIAGGESGPQARPSHPDWFRSLRDQCAAAGTPFLFKQWGCFAPQHDDISPLYWSTAGEAFEDYPVHGGWCFGRSATQRPWLMSKCSKEAAGRHLDGVLHDGFPGGVPE